MYAFAKRFFFFRSTLPLINNAKRFCMQSSNTVRAFLIIFALSVSCAHPTKMLQTFNYVTFDNCENCDSMGSIGCMHASDTRERRKALECANCQGTQCYRDSLVITTACLAVGIVFGSVRSRVECPRSRFHLTSETSWSRCRLNERADFFTGQQTVPV